MITTQFNTVVHKINYLNQKLRAGELPELLRHHRRKRLVRRLLTGKTGLEVGGPSRTFTPVGEVPAYPYADRVDNTNFAQVTVWEGAIAAGMTFQFDAAKPPGRQYVHDATDLRSIPTGTYDFILSSHTLEHVANPLRVLDEWRRVLTDDGAILITLPHPDGTFDHQRPTTTLAHLIADHDEHVEEDDLTHLDEILQHHDLSRDKNARDFESFRLRSLDNRHNRCLHHHVFDARSTVALIDHAGFQILDVEAKLPIHIIMIARKLPGTAQPDNRRFVNPNAKFRRISPFQRDRVDPRPQPMAGSSPTPKPTLASR